MPTVERKAELPSNEAHQTAASPRSRLRWPDDACSRSTIINGTGVFLLWLAVYGGANWITGLQNYRVSLETQVDSAIPFIPAAAIFYLSLFPMIWLAPFILHTPLQLRAFAGALATAISIAGIGFVLLPAEPIDFRSVETGLFGRMFQLADWINLHYNCFPSLHVAMAVVCAATFSRSQSATIAVFFWLWAAIIALSTLLTRQHYISDVVAGGLLGGAVSLRRPWTM